MSMAKVGDAQGSFQASLEGFWADIDRLAEVFHLGLFDPQVLAPLDWLVAATETSEQEIRELVDDGTLPKRIGQDGGLGFTIFTEAQIRFMKRLRSRQDRTEEEIRHVIWYENRMIEFCWLAVIPYDDQSVPDVEHFKRRVTEEIKEINASQEFYRSGRLHGPMTDSDVRRELDNLSARKAQLEKIKGDFESSIEGSLTSGQRRFYKKRLHRLRWLDEWVRADNATEYEAQIDQGYSPEFFFLKWSSDGHGKFEFGPPHWSETLAMYKDSRSHGKGFPLRTPDFTLSESGLTVDAGVKPDRYSQIFESYRLDDLFRLANEMGQELWNPAELADGMARCLECSRIFGSHNPQRIYCSEQCRQRAKSRRWRERDPERARAAQARYWRNAYSELHDEDA